MNRCDVRSILTGAFLAVVGLTCGHGHAAGFDAPPICEGPAWTRVKDASATGNRMQGVGSAACAAAEPDPAAQHAALTDAVRDLVVRGNRGELRVLSFFSENTALAAAAGTTVPGALPPGLADRLGELVSRVRARLRTEYWHDPCLKRLWCAVNLAEREIEEVTAALLARNDLDGVLDEALEALTGQTGQKARRLLVYQVLDKDGITEGPMGRALRNALGRVSTAQLRYDVVPREALDGILRKTQLDLGGLATGSTPARAAVESALDLILLGSYRKDHGVVRLDLVAVDPGYRQKGTITTYVFETAFPEAVRRSASEHEALLQEQATLEEAERRQADDERRRLDEEAYDALKKEALAEVRREEVPRLETELAAKYKKQFDEKYEQTVSQELRGLKKALKQQGVEQQAELERRASEQLGRIQEETRKLLEAQTEALKSRELVQRTNQAALAKVATGYQGWLDGRTPDSPLRVRAYLDRGCGATYRVGEEAVLFTKCNRDCYVKIFHRSQAGDVTLLLPNKEDGNNHLRGGVVHAIGDETYPFLFRIGKPLGIERIVVVAQETQFSDIDKVKAEYTAGGRLADYGARDTDGYRDVLYRGVTAEAREGAATTALTARDVCSLVVEE